MSEETPPYQVHGDDALEARIVAWVLGESSPFEVEELKRLCDERPELEIFRRRIQAIHELLGESEKQGASPAWKLNPAKRAALDTALGSPATAPINVVFPKKRRYPVWLTAAASVAILSGALLFIAYEKQGHVMETPTIITYSAEMRDYETDYPAELIQGTPVPITPESLLSRSDSQSRAANKPSAPSSAQAKVIASDTASPTRIPVPEIPVQEPSIAYGDSDNFGTGWGDTGGEGAGSYSSEYAIPTTETSAAADPFSTFSLNVSDAAFILARDAIRRGERPAPEQIRVEQFYNALDYGDPAPVAGEAVATHIEQTAHPVLPGRNLVRIAARVGSTGRAATQPLHITLLVDQSGSMVRADRQAILENTLTTLASLLGENDVVHVIGFARQPRLIAEALPGNRASEIRTLVHQSAAEGGTNMEAALELAQQIAARHQKPGAQNRVVLLSDGAVNLGDADPTRLAERITQMRQQGIATDIAGIGSDGLNDALLAELARHGDGRYHVVTPETGDRLARDLAGAFRPAASDVKVQVVFNPERVGGWKLIGFEEHRLNTEDFRDDTVDAAELAAEEAGVAIYQVETLPQGRGEIGEVFIRFRDTTTGNIIERSWPLPYDANTPALDQARPSMQLATLAMLTAEKLRGGPIGESIDLTTHISLIQTLQPHYRHDPRAHELFEMISALSER